MRHAQIGPDCRRKKKRSTYNVPRPVPRKFHESVQGPPDFNTCKKHVCETYSYSHKNHGGTSLVIYQT